MATVASIGDTGRVWYKNVEKGHSMLKRNR